MKHVKASLSRGLNAKVEISFLIFQKCEQGEASRRETELLRKACEQSHFRFVLENQFSFISCGIEIQKIQLVSNDRKY